jgi:hypothetical protein
MQTHHLCDTVKQRTVDMTEEAANHYFRDKMPERNDIFKHEAPTMDGWPTLHRHKHMCDRFKRAMQRGIAVEDFPHVKWWRDGASKSWLEQKESLDDDSDCEAEDDC